jgi:hypothetical protein
MRRRRFAANSKHSFSIFGNPAVPINAMDSRRTQGAVSIDTIDGCTRQAVVSVDGHEGFSIHEPPPGPPMHRHRGAYLTVTGGSQLASRPELDRVLAKLGPSLLFQLDGTTSQLEPS